MEVIVLHQKRKLQKDNVGMAQEATLRFEAATENIDDNINVRKERNGFF